ncbi:MAG: penicillin-binding protein 2 [Candidatus Calescibacterium sp.]|nr:penicillin-binding protein 2 [Candidatus Calescibacterium sp.]MDW8086828.1 penicillin-binding protein 2 [Candidatus Calescibacterium sp.]
MKYDWSDNRYTKTKERKNVKKVKQRKDFGKIRIFLSIVFFFLIVSLYLWRVLELSVFSKELRDKAREQSQSVITIKGRRGEILSRDGQIIAKDIPSYSVWFNPKAVKKDKDKTYALYKIAKRLNINQKELRSKLEKDLYFVWLKRKISEEELKFVLSTSREYGFTRSDIGYIKEWKRFYPYGEAIAHIVGFTNIDSQGLAGIELYFDEFLKGGEIKVSLLKDALGNIIMSSPPQEPTPGNKIETTIDLELQLNLYKELKSQVEKMRAKGAFAVAMDPKTGEILAAVSLPSFDPSNYSSFSGSRNINAQFYQSVFEPGSVFKIFTIASALEEKVVSENDNFFCHNGKWTFKTVTIEDVKPLGYATLNEVFAKSSNICSAQISLLLGKEKFYKYLVRLGFGKKTGVELPGEEKGILHEYKKWYDVDLAIIGFGYFISVNALQMLRAFSVFANGGYLVKPYVMRRIISPYGEVIRQNNPEFSDRIFSQETIVKMKNLMRDVVAYGTGRLAEVPVFLSGGKTGTARKMKGGKYVREYYSNFIGFSPFEDPKIVLFVVFDEPEEKYYGGEVAAPVFSKVVESYLSSNYSFVSISSEGQNYSAQVSESGFHRQYVKPVSSYSSDSTNSSELRLTLSEFLESIPEEKSNKSITIKGHGFVKEVRETETEIVVILSP